MMNLKVKKMLKKIMIWVFVIGMTLLSTVVMADEPKNKDFISDAASWYNQGGKTDVSLDMTAIVNVINVAGTAIIAIVTVILGMKYVLGSATGKSEVKEQLVSLLVACLLFFGWSNLSKILISGASFQTGEGTYSGISGATQLFIFKKGNSTADIDIETMFASVFALVVFVARIVAFIATMYIGVKYIFGGSDAKSEIKERGPMYIIGILMIFCTVGVLGFISDAILGAL